MAMVVLEELPSWLPSKIQVSDDAKDNGEIERKNSSDSPDRQILALESLVKAIKLWLLRQVM